MSHEANRVYVVQPVTSLGDPCEEAIICESLNEAAAVEAELRRIHARDCRVYPLGVPLRPADLPDLPRT